MQGTDVLKSNRTKDAITRIMQLMYLPSLYNLDEAEDLVLFTEERSNYSTIGTDSINLSVMKYMLTNSYWINVCLFVNEDFRSCFNDAIAIEKALLQVNDQEYEDFRDEMTLNNQSDLERDVNVKINIDHYVDEMEAMICTCIGSAQNDFKKAGMTDVYADLEKGFDKKTLTEMRYVIHNLVYVINSMNRNGVFYKYVRLVVESVKNQLS